MVKPSLALAEPAERSHHRPRLVFQHAMAVTYRELGFRFTPKMETFLGGGRKARKRREKRTSSWVKRSKMDLSTVQHVCLVLW